MMSIKRKMKLEGKKKRVEVVKMEEEKSLKVEPSTGADGESGEIPLPFILIICHLRLAFPSFPSLLFNQRYSPNIDTEKKSKERLWHLFPEEREKEREEEYNDEWRDKDDEMSKEKRRVQARGTFILSLSHYSFFSFFSVAICETICFSFFVDDSTSFYLSSFPSDYFT